MFSECSPGFRGWNCTEKCPENHYGKKCNTECRCNNETQICHPVRGCLQKLDLNMTNSRTSLFLENSSPYTEGCPSTIIDVISKSTGLIYCNSYTSYIRFLSPEYLLINK